MRNREQLGPPEEQLVQDPEIAQLMAEAEDPYHKKRLGGILPPSAKSLEQGQRAAKDVADWRRSKQAELEDRKARQEWLEQRRSEVKDLVYDVEQLPDVKAGFKLKLSMKGNIKGHEVEITGKAYEKGGSGGPLLQHNYVELTGSVDNKPLSIHQALQILQKYCSVGMTSADFVEHKKYEESKDAYHDIIDKIK